MLTCTVPQYLKHVYFTVHCYTLCIKKVPTFELSVTWSNVNRFSKLLHC